MSKFGVPLELRSEYARRAAAATNGPKAGYRFEGVTVSIEDLVRMSGLSETAIRKRLHRESKKPDPVRFSAFGITDEVLARNNLQRKPG